MRKRLITRTSANVEVQSEGSLDLEHAAPVEVTSEDTGFPVESSFSLDPRQGWRAAEPGTQTITITSISRSFEEAIRDREKVRRNLDKCPMWLSFIAFLSCLYLACWYHHGRRRELPRHHVLAFDSDEVAAVSGAFDTNSPSAAAPAAGSFHPPTKERSKDMFTRVVEMTSKSGKSQVLANTINDKAVPILKKQRGFVDEIVLVSSGKADQVLALSFWYKREDAEEYQREQYQKVHDTVRHLLEAEPEIRTFDEHTSTTHKIAACKAA